MKCLSRAQWPLFEREFLANARRGLFSTLGESGLEGLAERVRPYHRELVNLSVRAKAEPTALFNYALAVVYILDQDDIRAKDIPLREAPGCETYVPSKLLRVLLETLLPDSELRYILETQAGANSPKFIAAFALIDLLLENEEIDEAVTLTERTLSMIGLVAPLQHFLYRGLLRKKERGEISASPNICLDDLTTRFCVHPFQTLGTRSNLRYSAKNPLVFVHACFCPGLQIYPASANAADQSVDEIWNGAAIQEIRRSVLDGDFTYCSRMVCTDLMLGKLPKRDEITDPNMRDIIDNRRVVVTQPPTKLELLHDPSCNLACPSCRTELQVIKNETRSVLDRFSENVLLPLMNDTTMQLVISGDGDPFGSKHYRKLIYSLDPVKHTNIQLTFLTNGLLLTPREWEALGWRQKLIVEVLVSIDAAQKETYEDVRRPGKWETICTNMDMIGSLRKQGAIPALMIQFVVQRKNYNEMADFVKLGQKWNADRVCFQRLFATYKTDPGDFISDDVCDPSHPEHSAFLEMLSDPIFMDPIIDMTNVDPLLKKALELRRPPAQAAQPGERGVKALAAGGVDFHDGAVRLRRE